MGREDAESILVYAGKKTDGEFLSTTPTFASRCS